MMLKNCFVLMCVVVLLQLGNIHSTELSRMRRDGGDFLIRPYPVPAGRPDRKTQGDEIVYKCILPFEGSKRTLIFQQKSRGSESWGPVRGHIQRRNANRLAEAELKFKADFKLHDGSSFRCLAKDNPKNPKPIQFDMIVFHNTGHSTTDLPKTTKDPNQRTTKDRSTTDQTTTDQTITDRTILYFSCGATGFILIVLITVGIIRIIVIIRRCRRRSPDEGHVETSTRPLQLESRNEELYIYEDPDDCRNPDNVLNRKPVRNTETGLLQHNIQTHKAMRAEKGKDTTPYIDMEAGRSKYMASYIDIDEETYRSTEGAIGNDTTPYMDMGPGIEEDTYRSTEGAIDVTTTGAVGDSDTDQYMNPEALKRTYLQLVADTDAYVEDDDQLYSYATVECKAPYMDMGPGIDEDTYMSTESAIIGKDKTHTDMEAGKGKDTTPYMDMKAGIYKDTTPYIDMEAGKGKDTTPYMDMEAGKGKNTTPYIDMEAGKGKDTTPYMDMEAGKGKDTTPYMDMKAGKGKDTTPFMDMEAGKGKDTTPYMDMEAGKGKDTTPYMDMKAGKGKDTTPYMDMEAGKGKDTTRGIDMEAGKAASSKKDTTHT
ncbi:uncharacterized protein LOC141907468 [Tubulanus polymorphus]|uniref:uncharacterized protein LOC141907468 n=1 Tax=Tubulanus polymorphus TaxID=672921 RepID=UPI003DA31A18